MVTDQIPCPLSYVRSRISKSNLFIEGIVAFCVVIVVLCEVNGGKQDCSSDGFLEVRFNSSFTREPGTQHSPQCQDIFVVVAADYSVVGKHILTLLHTWILILISRVPQVQSTAEGRKLLLQYGRGPERLRRLKRHLVGGDSGRGRVERHLPEPR